LTGFSGKYRLDARLGGGGMAEVFLGSTVGAEGFSRKVAIKRVLPGFSENPAFAKMFIDEARISSRLVHPNIVSVVDFDRDPDGRLYLVMELVEGKDLDELGASGALPVPVVIYVISEVLRGLGHAHDLPVTADAMRGIVHRDVSPHNVLLSWEGAVKVSDFGIAKARSASAATASELIKGKPAYMSPEQANGESLDGRSDLFAVGVMLWELLVGRRLFVGEDTRATLAAVLFGQIPRPRSLRPDVPKDLERVVMKLLERDLPARYATAEAAIHDLLECAAAPKDGRNVLASTLADRFPQHAPVRHSVARSRVGTPPAGSTPPHVEPPIHDRVTIADGHAGRPSRPPAAAAALPSIGELRSAPTAAMRPAATPIPRRDRRKPVVIAASAVAAAAILFGVIATVARDEAPRGTAAGSGSAASVAAAEGSGSVSLPAGQPAVATVQSRVDAGVPEAPVPLTDAAVPEAAKKDATVAKPGEKRVGRLKVTAYPVLTVYIDNAKLGHDTPFELNLPVGKHRLRLVNTELGKDETTTVTIEENKQTLIDRN
jgi:serine/threonine-protein kinase